MEESVEFGGVPFISSRRAAREMGYTKDYVGQLCRAGKVDARLVGRSWYVNPESLKAHRSGVELQWRGEERDARTDMTVEQVPTEAHDEVEAEHALTQYAFEAGVSHRADMRPVPLEDFAMTRMPTRMEIERKLRQDALLSTMDVSYEDSKPVFFEDDRPLNPSPYRVARFEDTPVSVATDRYITEKRDTANNKGYVTARAPVSSVRTSPMRTPERARVRHSGTRMSHDVVDGVVTTARSGQIRLGRRGVEQGYRAPRREVAAYGFETEHVDTRPRRGLGTAASVVVAVAVVSLSLLAGYALLSMPDPGSTTTANASGSGIIGFVQGLFSE